MFKQRREKRENASELAWPGTSTNLTRFLLDLTRLDSTSTRLHLKPKERKRKTAPYFPRRRRLDTDTDTARCGTPRLHDHVNRQQARVEENLFFSAFSCSPSSVFLLFPPFWVISYFYFLLVPEHHRTRLYSVESKPERRKKDPQKGKGWNTGSSLTQDTIPAREKGQDKLFVLLVRNLFAVLYDITT